jgi:hypothetical protein
MRRTAGTYTDTIAPDFVMNKPLAGTSCVPSSSTLCLNSSRFKVSVSWRDFQNNAGSGTAVPLTNDTGYFWFFNSANVEMIIKVLDGRPINGKFWVFYGALSNVEYTITVTDTVTGQTKTYQNPLGNFASAADTSALGDKGAGDASFELLSSPVASPAITTEEPVAKSFTPEACGSDGQTLCLNNSRFRVSVTWRDFSGNTGVGHAVGLTSDTGYFWFFSDTNVELVLKVLDGRGLNGKFWVFYGALSNVSYTITVTDTVTGMSKTYNNASGSFGSVGDTTAFDDSSPPPNAGSLRGGSFTSASDLAYWALTGSVAWDGQVGHDGKPGEARLLGYSSISQCVQLTPTQIGKAAVATAWYSAPLSTFSLRLVAFQDQSCSVPTGVVFQRDVNNGGESYAWAALSVESTGSFGSFKVEAAMSNFGFATYVDDIYFSAGQ